MREMVKENVIAVSNVIRVLCMLNFLCYRTEFDTPSRVLYLQMVNISCCICTSRLVVVLMSFYLHFNRATVWLDSKKTTI